MAKQPPQPSSKKELTEQEKWDLAGAGSSGSSSSQTTTYVPLVVGIFQSHPYAVMLYLDQQNTLQVCTLDEQTDITQNGLEPKPIGSILPGNVIQAIVTNAQQGQTIDTFPYCSGLVI